MCYERAAPLCHSLNEPRLLFVVLSGQIRYALHRGKLSGAMQIAERMYSLAQEQNDSALMIGACRALACTLYCLSDFESARQYAMRGVQIWRSGNVQTHAEDYITPVVDCFIFWALSDGHFGEVATCHALMDEAISIAKEQKDRNALAHALHSAAALAANDRNYADVDRLSSDLIELSTRHNFSYWLAQGTVWRGWARSVSGNTAEGIPWIEQGIRDFRATGTVLAMSGHLATKAAALHLADHTSEALEAINEAEAIAQRFEHGYCRAKLHRLRGVLLAALGADENQIEASFCEAIRIAKEQKSVSLEKGAEATYAEYRSTPARNKRFPF